MSDQDQNFMDVFTLVLGILVGISFAIFLLARSVGDATQQQWVQEDEMFQQQILSRIAPIGEVGLPGGVPRDEAGAAETIETAPVKETLSGPQVYNSACLACHGAGIGGAPKVGDTAAWSARIAQGNDVLTDHVINGYTGDAGYMPPKGGRVDLSDEEILAALNYMIEESS